MNRSSITWSWLQGICVAELTSLAFPLTSAEPWAGHFQVRCVKSTFSLLIFINSTASGIELFGASVRCWKYRAREGGSKRKQRPASVGIPKAHCLLVQKYICKQLYLHMFPYAIFCSTEISLTCHQIYLFSVYKSMIPHKFTRFYNILTIQFQNISITPKISLVSFYH